MEQEEERAFVERQLSELIREAASICAKGNGFDACVVDETDKKEFFETEVQIEPAPEMEGRLRSEFHETKMFKENEQTERSDDSVEASMVKENAQPESLSVNKFQFEAKIEPQGGAPGRKLEVAYKSHIDDSKFKMLVARASKDYEFRVYPLHRLIPRPKSIRDVVVGAVGVAGVGGAISTVIGPTAVVGGLAALAGGSALVYGIQKLMAYSGNFMTMTAKEVFSQFGNENKCVWREEGRSVFYEFKYNYKHLAQAVTIEEMVIHNRH